MDHVKIACCCYDFNKIILPSCNWWLDSNPFHRLIKINVLEMKVKIKVNIDASKPVAIFYLLFKVTLFSCKRHACIKLIHFYFYKINQNFFYSCLFLINLKSF